MNQFLYYLTCTAYIGGGLVLLGAVLFAFSLEMGKWWQRDNPPRQVWGEGRGR